MLRHVGQQIDIDPVGRHEPEVADDGAGELRDLGRHLGGGVQGLAEVREVDAVPDEEGAGILRILQS